MPEPATACPLAGPFPDSRRHNRANPAESRLAILLIGRPDKSPPPLTSSFRDDKQRKLFPLLFPLADLCADAFVAKRNFRNQNDVTAAGDARVRSDPAGVTSHDFEHHHAVVAFSRRAQTVERVGGASDGGVKTEGDDRGFKIVVDGFGNAHQGNAALKQLLRDGERAVAAHAHQRAQTDLVKIAFRPIERLCRDFPDLTVAGLRREPSFVGGAEDGAAQEKQTVHLMIVEAALTQVEQPFETVEEADGVPATLGRRLDHRPDDCVQSWTITAAREDADALVHDSANLADNRQSAIGDQSTLTQLFG